MYLSGEAARVGSLTGVVLALLGSEPWANFRCATNDPDLQQ